MRGNNVMKGYYRDPEATAQAFAGGYFHSGDIAVMHPDGYLEIADRAKDVIISGGENISTVQVEKVILEHPDVLECAVVAKPDETWGEVPKAFVVVKPGREVSAEALIAHCRERLPHFKAPKEIEFGELPKTSTGKIQKFVLAGERMDRIRKARALGGARGDVVTAAVGGAAGTFEPRPSPAPVARAPDRPRRRRRRRAVRTPT